ncbi:MAG: hypothetical protein KAG98_06795, partial [Lentisphaeria bacterium]|nr:hypothetical protein [Lentisphaeria bacterium]
MFRNFKLMLLSLIPLAIGCNSIKTDDVTTFYPEKSGSSAVELENKQSTIENKVIKVDWKLNKGLTLGSVNNLYTGQSSQLDVPLFNLYYTLNGKAMTLSSVDCRVQAPKVTPLTADLKASVYAKQLPGQKVDILLQSKNLDINVSLIIRKDSNYVRQVYTFTPKSEITVDRLDFFPGFSDKWKSVGVSRGAPMV